MKRVGILVGREKTFPDALIKLINERGKGEVVAEFIKLGGIRVNGPSPNQPFRTNSTGGR